MVTAAVLASFNNTVFGLDIDEDKVASLKKGKVPFYEPQLEELLLREQKRGNLTFTTNYKEAIETADVVVIAVGTPSTEEGKADLSYVMAATESMSPFLKEDAIVVVKSTVPPGTLDVFEESIKRKTDKKFHMASIPEFLREGTAVEDTLHPDRVVIGATDPSVYERLEELHSPLGAPMVRMSPESAQMAKYAANAYLATRITFINQIADICEKNGADIEEVIEGIGHDKRIGRHYWYPGFGYGGSCFPKDVRELAYYSREVGLDRNLLVKINEINDERIPKIMSQLEKEVGGFENKTVAVLGLAFKPHTDDMREAPSTKVVPWLLKKGASVVGYDPKAQESAERVLPSSPQLSYSATVDAAIKDADVIMCLIEWPEVVSFDYVDSKHPDKTQWIIDARNQLDSGELEAAGYKYFGIGR